MSYLEHESEKLGDCGCPSCDLYNKYLKDYTAYKTRDPYRSFGMADDIDLDAEMNDVQKAGYELAYVIPGHHQKLRVVVMRAVPPATPNAADIIIELKRRNADAGDAVKGIDLDNLDKIGPTVGEA